MKHKIEKNGNTLLIDSKKVQFDYEIRDFKTINNMIIVLLAIPFDDSEIDNVYGVSVEAEIVWRVESLNKINVNKNNMPYENIFLSDQGELSASDFYGRKYYINICDGHILRKEIVK